MRTEFKYSFKAGMAVLTEPVAIKFAASGSIPIQRGETLIGEDVHRLQVEIQLVPEKKGQIDGRLLLTVPGRPQEIEAFAGRLANDIAELLAFFYPGFRLLGGVVMFTRLPENEADEKEIGDKPFGGSLRVIEVDPGLPFDREHLRLFPYSLDLQRTLRQYNAARSAQSKPEAFVAMFKVIENLYHRGNRKAKDALKSSDELRDVLRGQFTITSDQGQRDPTDADVNKLIEEFVDTRDACAHLKEHNSFGFAPHDRRVYEEVEPLYDLLEGAARDAIQRRLDAAKASAGKEDKG